MRLTVIAMGILAMMMSGCSSTPQPTYSPAYLNNLLAPKAGMAKLIVYYPLSASYSSAWSGRKVDVKLQGIENCRLTSGNFFTRDVTSGSLAISASLCNGNGVSQLTIHLIANNKYYIQVMPKDESVVGRIASRNVSVTENPATHAEGTAFFIDRVDEQTAMKQLSLLKMEEQ